PGRAGARAGRQPRTDVGAPGRRGRREGARRCAHHRREGGAVAATTGGESPPDGAGDFKKGGHLLRQGERVKFAFISEEKVAFPVAVLCRLLAVSPSGFYATQGRPRSRHARRDDKLTERVVEAHAASKGRYGSPRVHAELKAAGERVGRKRVARLMREKKLTARTRRRFRTTTDSKHDFPIAPNVLER